MKIYADNINYAKRVVPGINTWGKIKANELDSEQSFIHQILTKENLIFTELAADNFWNYLLISKYSSNSQFDTLYESCGGKAGIPDGIICIADSGAKFHGYRNRAWKTESGNLHISIFKKPNQGIKNFHIGFTILSAVSLIQTLNSVDKLNKKASIKWVNDILIENKKIGGVITQTHSQQKLVTGVVLGIGLNVINAPIIESDSFVGKSTCLLNYINKNEINFSNIVFDLLKNLEINYQILLQNNYSELFTIYKKNSIVPGKQVEIYSDTREGENSIIASGVVTGINENLELFLDNKNTPVRYGRLKIIR